ncbi:MAG TPA: enoyl-CoA hydratase-related protein [Pseudomonadales bacterium]|nr:enoyl-CoA hydratase-related protein [Pseudomonadales bacterium]
MSELVRVEIDGGVGKLILNRHKAMNTLNVEMARAIRQATQRLAWDDSVRVVLLCTDGPYFMAGGDISYFGVIGNMPSQVEKDLATQELIQEAHMAIRAMRTMPKPIVASINGGAAGIGISFIAACDLAIAADNCTFTTAYIMLGATPDGGATYTLPRLMGMKQAAELIMLSDRFDSQRALQLGLFNKVVPADQLAAETEKLVQRLANGPTQAYARAKQLLNASMVSSLDEQLELEEASFVACSKTADYAEGVAAFVGKRKPDFKGK